VREKWRPTRLGAVAEEFCAQLLSSGWTEYPPPRGESAHKRAFSHPVKFDGPLCTTNEKPPALHAEVSDFGPTWRYESATPAPGVELVFFGERPDDTWIQCRLYSIPMGEFFDRLPGLHLTASELWRAFYRIPTNLEIVVAAGRKEEE
jgi:hypothetical protein